MKRFSPIGIAFALLILAAPALAQSTGTSRTTGSRDASITTNTTTGAQQPAASPTPFTPGINLPPSPTG